MRPTYKQKNPTISNVKSLDLWSSRAGQIRTFSFYPISRQSVLKSDGLGAILVVERDQHPVIVQENGIHKNFNQRFPLLFLRNIELSKFHQPEPDVTSGTVADATGRCRVTWFNQPYLRNQLRRGMTFVFRGKMSKKGNLSVLEQPEIYTPAAYEEKLNSMQPKYALTAGLSNHMVTKMVKAALEQLDLTQDYLPEEIRLEYELAEYNFAAVQIHFPSNQEQYLEARKRLAFDEFLLFILGLKQLKEQTAADKNHYRMKEVWKTEEVIENLPYQLTGAQKNVWYEIEQDLRGEKLMTRLVQGDVGSGKTIVAFLAMIMTAENGYQSAIMVPTEVLAKQHYEALTKLLEENGLLEQYQPVFLTGSNTAKEKRQIYEAIASGETRMIVGTHALIQEKVIYESLG